MNNLEFLRVTAGVETTLLSKLLNITCHTYKGIAQERIQCPKEVAIMLSRIYRIDVHKLSGDQSAFTDEELHYFKHLASITADERRRELFFNLSGNTNGHPTYKSVQAIIDTINHEKSFSENRSQADDELKTQPIRPNDAMKRLLEGIDWYEINSLDQKGKSQYDSIDYENSVRKWYDSLRQMIYEDPPKQYVKTIYVEQNDEQVVLSLEYEYCGQTEARGTLSIRINFSQTV